MRALVVVVLVSLAFGAHSQEYEARSEFTYCTLNEGKTLEDVIEQSEFYGDFRKSRYQIPAGRFNTNARWG